MTIEMSNLVPDISFHEKISRIHLIYLVHENACHSIHVMQPWFGQLILIALEHPSVLQ